MNRKKAKNFKSSGFSIIEMMVVMGIIGILSVLILANYRVNQKKYALTMATQQLVSDLRKAQNMAISGSGISAAGYSGYGIHAENNSVSYIIFGDKNNNRRYDGSDGVVQVFSLPANIKIVSVSPSSNGLDVAFVPPGPATYVNNNSAVGISATFTLQTDDGSATKIINVTTAGLINN